MQINLKRNEIIEGVIWKQLLFFFFPIVLGTFFQQFYNTIDAVVVGRFVGKNALAAVGGSAGQIQNLVIGFFTGLTSGASVIVSQFLGSRDADRVNESIHTIYAFSVIGSVVVMILGLLLSPMILEMMNTPPELLEESIIYLRIYFAGIFFVFIYNSGSSILRALGDSKRPLYYLIVCSVINIVLDLLMVLVFNMGVAGVAIATLIAQAVSSVLVTRALMKSENLCQFSLKKIRFHRQMLKAQLSIGLPGGFQSTMYNLSNIIVQSALNIFGTNTAAAWAAYGKMDAIFWMISGSFGIAITTFVGQNLGARKIDRVRQSTKVGTLLCFAVAILITIPVLIFARPLVSMFNRTPEVLDYGTLFIRLEMPFYLALCINQVHAGTLRGIGNTKAPMVIMMSCFIVFRQIYLYTITQFTDSVIAVALGYPLGWVLCSICLFTYYRHTKLETYLR